jgi:hypothetical protein
VAWLAARTHVGRVRDTCRESNWTRFSALEGTRCGWRASKPRFTLEEVLPPNLPPTSARSFAIRLFKTSAQAEVVRGYLTSSSSSMNRGA